jgi:hypothetical protein
MHRKKSDIYRNRRVVLIVGSLAALVIAACLAVIFTAGGSSGNAFPASKNAKGTNCSIKDMGPVPVQVANDSSSCFIQKVIHPGSAINQQ